MDPADRDVVGTRCHRGWGFPVRSDAPEFSERTEAQSFPYDAFISYDHDDRAVAHGIQRGLKRIGRRFGQPPALRVFRDSTDLTASPDLWGKVTEALDRSRYLVVVQSPSAVASKWVNREVAHWLERRGSDHVLFVVASGCLVWDEAAGRFDPGSSDAALPVLTQPGALPAEPFYVDVSDDAPWDPDAPLFREKVTDLAAPIHGKPKSELASEDLREQRRIRGLRRAAIAGLVVLTVVALGGRVGDLAMAHRRWPATRSHPPTQPGRDQSAGRHRAEADRPSEGHAGGAAGWGRARLAADPRCGEPRRPRRCGCGQRVLQHGDSTDAHLQDHHRSHLHGGRCGVQPRRAPAGQYQLGWDASAVGRGHRPIPRLPIGRARAALWGGVQPRRASAGVRCGRQARCGCGMPIPGGRSAPRSKATPRR